MKDPCTVSLTDASWMEKTRESNRSKKFRRAFVVALLKLGSPTNERVQMSVTFDPPNVVVRRLARRLYMFRKLFIETVDPHVVAQLKAVTLVRHDHLCATCLLDPGRP